MPTTQAERLIGYARGRGIVRPRELERLRISLAVLKRLVEPKGGSSAGRRACTQRQIIRLAQP